MKTLQLSIIVTLILIVPAIQNVIAMPNLSPQDLYKASEMVFYGQVISKQAGPGPDYYYYQVKVQTYFKNPQTSDSITVAGHKPSERHVTYPQFEIGDKAIFYINKIDGINTISPYSQKTGDACDVHSFLGPEYFGSLGNYHGGPASNPRITDVNGNALERILTNQEIVLSYDDVWNNYPESRTIPVSISIQNEDNGKQIFNNTQNLEVQACSFAGTLKWNFVPTEIGNYIAKIDIDNKTKMTMGFSVIFVSPANSQIILSPLKQFKSGIAANDVKCQQDLQLVIKAEDGFPACVKPQTSQKLVEHGWGWAMQTMDSLKPLPPNKITGLENDTGVATLGNQTYYFETPNYTNTAYSNPVQISFHDVIFTLFPPGFRGGLPTDHGCEGTMTGIITGSGSYYWTDAKFPDGIHELLHIFAYSKLSCPVHSIPTYFSTHTNPQAGLTFYDGKMKLLVSTNNQAVPQLEKISVMINGVNSDFSFNYTITGGQIEQANADISNKALILSMKTTGNGTLIVDLPRGLIDPQINGQDSKFIIIEDGKEVEYTQIETTATDRVLEIPFQYSVSKIEIIAPEPIR